MNSDIWTSSSIHDLTDEEIESFRDIVLRDVKNQISSDHEEKSILINNLDLWLYCLRTIRREIELQLANHKSSFKFKIKELYQEGISEEEVQDYIHSENRWRTNAMKFLTAIERKTLYVKLLIQEDQD